MKKGGQYSHEQRNHKDSREEERQMQHSRGGCLDAFATSAKVKARI